MDKDLEIVILRILAAQTELTLATNRADGFPQATTVSYVSEEFEIYFATAPQSQKVQNITRDPRVSATITPAYSDWNSIRGISLGGRAAALSGQDRMRILALFFAKFPSVAQYAPRDRMAMAVYRITPEIVSVLDYTRGFGHTDLVDLRPRVA